MVSGLFHKGHNKNVDDDDFVDVEDSETKSSFASVSNPSSVMVLASHDNSQNKNKDDNVVSDVEHAETESIHIFL